MGIKFDKIGWQNSNAPSYFYDSDCSKILAVTVRVIRMLHKMHLAISAKIFCLSCKNWNKTNQLLPGEFGFPFEAVMSTASVRCRWILQVRLPCITYWHLFICIWHFTNSFNHELKNKLWTFGIQWNASPLVDQVEISWTSCKIASAQHQTRLLVNMHSVHVQQLQIGFKVSRFKPKVTM